MKSLYGIPYMGSKTKIAEDIIRRLPGGGRFVDLFGGGFAMSHCAQLSGKYKSILYNDLNPLITDVVSRAIAGEFNYSIFKPPWISREDFHRLKDTDGYVKYIWSFGNSGKEYLFGKDVEPFKKAGHNFVVFGKWSNILQDTVPNVRSQVTSGSISERRKQFCRSVKAVTKKRCELQQLEQLERLQQLERLEQLESVERLDSIKSIEPIKLQVTNKSYTEYEYQFGDIVYCDPPYEDTAEYDGAFDSKAFYDWAYSQPYQIWFSSYKISDNRFKMLWAREIYSSFGSGATRATYECLYTNKKLAK